MFTRIDAGEVPDAKTILKIALALGPEVIEQLHRQVIEVAKRAGVTHGRRFRIDTTVVETNVHYPTDSSLLQDGVRVLTRTMQRASGALGDRRGRVRDRRRSVGRRVLIIGRQARSPETRDALVHSDRRLMATTRAVIRDAATMVRRISQRLRTASRLAAPTLIQTRQQLQQLQPLVTRVLAQSRARLLGGDTHVPDKVLSIFEPHAEGQDREADGVRQARDNSGKRASDRHRLRGPPDSTGGHDPVDARARSAHRGFRPRPRYRGRGPRLCVREERRRRSGARCPASDPAAAGTENTSAARARTAALVPSRPALARRVRRPHQCAQTTTWSSALSLSWRRRHRALGRARRHRGQSREHRKLLKRADRRIENGAN